MTTGTELTRQEPSAVQPQADLMAVIARAASDSTVDVDKMERLFALKERMDAQARATAYAAALCNVQALGIRVTQHGTISYGQGKATTKFAKLEDIDDALCGPMAKEGLSLTVSAPVMAGGLLMVTGTLRHRDGHKEEVILPLPPDKSGGKNEVQAMASTILGYGRRLMLKSFFRVIEVGEDRDGDMAPKTITQKQADELNDILDEIGSGEKARFLRWAGVDKLADVTAAKFETGMKVLLGKRGGK